MNPDLCPTCTPWLPVASRVLAGHFDNAELPMLYALEIGLRHIAHEDCQKAVGKVRQMIESKKPTPRKP